MKTGLYFGSFNPFHTGHAAISKWLLTDGGLDKLVLVVSPQNPLKDQAANSTPQQRLAAVRSAARRLTTRLTGENPGEISGELPPKFQIDVSDIEFSMTPPLYTINTMREMRDKIYPGENLILIIGADNLAIIEKWHSWQVLLDEFEVWVYPRKGFDADSLCQKYGTRLIAAPRINISSTQIREAAARGEDVSSFLA
ncbi:MAG: nicotinic acid mononucleotide adenylyltransferase [Bacteroidetes bacterium HGW-Bacteroidetes-10]|nr:MAG: nicotinic acid mononucleotide adenylyltransferase [Bacteroidetes bacterium HGW-Bacteroidetes-10]